MSHWRGIQIISMVAVVMLAGCMGGGGKSSSPGGPIDIELANSEAAADSAYMRGATAEAAILYRRALTRARAMDDPAAISETAYNVAACEIAMGNYDLAPQLLEEARDETLRAGGNTADVLLVMAKVAWLRNRPTEALERCGEVLSSRESRPTDVHRSQVHLLRGQIACGNGDVSGADAELAQAKKLAGAAPSPGRSAGLENLAGLIDQRRGQGEAAAAAFDREADDYRNARLFRDMTRALGRAAAAWEGAGQFGAAAERYFRAARSALAQGDARTGERFLDNAATDSTKAGDKLILRKIESLKNETQASQ